MKKRTSDGGSKKQRISGGARRYIEAPMVAQRCRQARSWIGSPISIFSRSASSLSNPRDESEDIAAILRVFGPSRFSQSRFGLTKGKHKPARNSPFRVRPAVEVFNYLLYLYVSLTGE